MVKISQYTQKPPSEHEEQVGLVMWFRNKFPDVLIYAIPNGDKRSVSVGRRLKKEGVVAGMPDLHVPEWNLWIEMKRAKGGSLSSKQKNIIEYLKSIDQTVIVGKGASDASRQIIEFFEGFPS